MHSNLSLYLPPIRVPWTLRGVPVFASKNAAYAASSCIGSLMRVPRSSKNNAYGSHTVYGDPIIHALPSSNRFISGQLSQNMSRAVSLRFPCAALSVPQSRQPVMDQETRKTRPNWVHALVCALALSVSVSHSQRHGRNCETFGRKTAISVETQSGSGRKSMRAQRAIAVLPIVFGLLRHAVGLRPSVLVHNLIGASTRVRAFRP